MKTIRLKWMREIALRSGGPDGKFIYSADWSNLPDVGGLYVFGRRYGKDFEALYVGKAANIRSRIRQQCEFLPLMMHLKNAKRGKKVLWVACFVPGSGGKSAPKCIDIAERALIRHFMLEGHNLSNTQGSRIRRHEIHSTGGKVLSGKIVPAKMFLER